MRRALVLVLLAGAISACGAEPGTPPPAGPGPAPADGQREGAERSGAAERRGGDEKSGSDGRDGAAQGGGPRFTREQKVRRESVVAKCKADRRANRKAFRAKWGAKPVKRCVQDALG